LHIDSFFYDVLKGEILVILEFIPGTDERSFISKKNSVAEIAKTNNLNLVTAYSRIKNLPIIVQKLKWKDDLLAGFENIEAIVSYKKLGET